MYRTAVILSLFAYQFVSAQPLDSVWSRTYGGPGNDQPSVVQQTPDGGFVVFGYSASFGDGLTDYALLRINAQGDSLWWRSFGGTGHSSVCWSGVQTSGGDFLMAGNTDAYGSGSSDFWLVKASANGDSLWSRSYGGTGTEYCYSITATSDGGYALGGQTRSFGEQIGDFWLVKVNAQGDSLWSRTYGGTARDYCRQVVPLADGYLLVGQTESFGNGSHDIWIVRTAANGDSLWSRTLGGTELDQFFSALLTEEGDFVIAGRTASYGVGQYDAWLIKLSASGDTLWTKTYGGALGEVAYSIVPAEDGGYYLAGWTDSFGAGMLDYWLVAVNENGDSLWSETYGGTSHDQCYSVTQTSDGGVILCGATLSYGAGDADFWFVKLGVADPVARERELLPNSLSLTASPNPFNSTCTISFDLPADARTTLRVLDLLGREVTILEQRSFEPGTHRVVFDARAYASGTYIVELRSGHQVTQTRLVLLK